MTNTATPLRFGYFLVPNVDNGWRWALALGAVPAVWALVIRFGLPESVRFLESKGRYREAENAVQEFEDSAGIVKGLQTKLDGHKGQLMHWSPGRAEAMAVVLIDGENEHRERGTAS